MFNSMYGRIGRADFQAKPALNFDYRRERLDSVSGLIAFFVAIRTIILFPVPTEHKGGAVK